MARIARLRGMLDSCVRVDRELLTREVNTLVDRCSPFCLEAYGTNGKVVFDDKVIRSCRRIGRKYKFVTQKRKKQFFHRLRNLVKEICRRQYFTERGLERKARGTPADIEAIRKTEGHSESDLEPWGGAPSSPEPSSEESLSTEPRRNQRHVRFALEAIGPVAQVSENAEGGREVVVTDSNTAASLALLQGSGSSSISESRIGGTEGENHEGAGSGDSSESTKPDGERPFGANSVGSQSNGTTCRPCHPQTLAGIETRSACGGEELVRDAILQANCTRREDLHASRSGGRQQAPLSSASSANVTSVHQNAPTHRCAARLSRVEYDKHGRFSLGQAKDSINITSRKRRAEEWSEYQLRTEDWTEDQLRLCLKKGRFDERAFDRPLRNKFSSDVLPEVQ